MTTYIKVGDIMEQYVIALILGIIEGITECIPVSSTGHMIIIGHMLNFEGAHADVFDVFIQIGAILAIYTHYRRIFNSFLKRKNWIKARGVSLLHIGAGVLPVLTAGYLLQYVIKGYLFGPIPVIIGLVVGALFMIYAEKRRVTTRLVDSVNNLSVYQCFQIGLYQMLCLWPGFSRSGATIAGGMLIGCTRRAAADFSFIMAVPVMIIVCVYDLLRVIHLLELNDIIMFAIGTFVSYIVGYITVKAFLWYLNRSSLSTFGYYRLIVATLAVIYLYL